MFIMINSNRSWLLTAIQSLFYHIFQFCHLITSQVCFMTHYIDCYLLLNTWIWNYNKTVVMSWRIVQLVQTIFDWFSGGSFAARCCACFTEYCRPGIFQKSQLTQKLQSSTHINIIQRFKDSGIAGKSTSSEIIQEIFNTLVAQPAHDLNDKDSTECVPFGYRFWCGNHRC